MYEALEAEPDEHLVHADEYVIAKSSAITLEGAEEGTSMSMMQHDDKSQLSVTVSKSMVVEATSDASVSKPVSIMQHDDKSQLAGSKNMVVEATSDTSVSKPVSKTQHDDKSDFADKGKREISASKRHAEVKTEYKGHEVEEAADTDAEVDDIDSDSEDDDEDEDDDDDNDDDDEADKDNDDKDVQERRERKKLQRKRLAEAKAKHADDDTGVKSSKREEEAGNEAETATLYVRRRIRKIKASDHYCNVH